MTMLDWLTVKLIILCCPLEGKRMRENPLFSSFHYLSCIAFYLGIETSP
jgi:hypothetical protein